MLLTPQGRTLTQATAQELALGPQLILLCGHYEGFDERVREHLVTDEISVGDYVLTGGELPALIVIDAVTRLQAGTLGNAASAEDDTFFRRTAGISALHAPARFSGLARS